MTNAIETLKELVPEGTTVYSVLKHVSKSGMMRAITFLVIADNRIICIDYWLKEAGLGKIHKKTQALVVNGTGMDMGFHIVYSLGRLLYDNGYSLNSEWK